MADVLTKGPELPDRVILHATEGWGKTSFGAMAPKPFFVQSRGETGLATLIQYSQLPPTPHAPAAETWAEALDHLDFVLTEKHDFQTLVVDTINGMERLCFEHVCEAEFKSDWGETGFLSYGKGPEVSLAQWRVYLSKLDRIRTERSMGIILLCHSWVKPFKNPEGSDYERYQAKMHEKFWALTKEWADVVLFGNYEVLVLNNKGKESTDPTKRGKAKGGETRILQTERTAAYDAKNRLGLPSTIFCGDSASTAWQAYESAKGAKQNG